MPTANRVLGSSNCNCSAFVKVSTAHTVCVGPLRILHCILCMYVYRKRQYNKLLKEQGCLRDCRDLTSLIVMLMFDR